MDCQGGACWCHWHLHQGFEACLPDLTCTRHAQLPAPFSCAERSCRGPIRCFALVRTAQLPGASFPTTLHQQTPPNQVELIMEKMPNLLTSKPVIYLVNMSATDYTRKKNKWLPKIHAWIQEHGGGVMTPFSVEFEAKLWEMRDNPSAKEVSEGMTPCCQQRVIRHVAASDTLQHQTLHQTRGGTLHTLLRGQQYIKYTSAKITCRHGACTSVRAL